MPGQLARALKFGKSRNPQGIQQIGQTIATRSAHHGPSGLYTCSISTKICCWLLLVLALSLHG